MYVIVLLANFQLQSFDRIFWNLWSDKIMNICCEYFNYLNFKHMSEKLVETMLLRINSRENRNFSEWKPAYVKVYWFLETLSFICCMVACRQISCFGMFSQSAVYWQKNSLGSTHSYLELTDWNCTNCTLSILPQICTTTCSYYLETYFKIIRKLHTSKINYYFKHPLVAITLKSPEKKWQRTQMKAISPSLIYAYSSCGTGGFVPFLVNMQPNLNQTQDLYTTAVFNSTNRG